MPTMTKFVNIKASIPVRNIKPPISGNISGIVMTTGDVLKCLCKRAIVEEVLPNGSTVRLNMKNYCTDNGAGLYVTSDPSAIAEKAEDIKPTPDPVKEVVEDVSKPVVEEIIEEQPVIETVNEQISEPVVEVAETLSVEEPISEVVEETITEPVAEVAEEVIPDVVEEQVIEVAKEEVDPNIEVVETVDANGETVSHVINKSSTKRTRNKKTTK